MKINPRRPTPAQRKVADREPAVLWWMPLPGFVLAAGWATWQAIQDADSSVMAFVEALAWPGLAIFAVTTLAVWL
ncbi:MAG TPA: hypothetical protein VFO84_03030, partial [Dehalococcoidia bacterium]|nr:hypothetical protein [Dehalococcoidia bacterium]